MTRFLQLFLQLVTVRQAHPQYQIDDGTLLVVAAILYNAERVTNTPTPA